MIISASYRTDIPAFYADWFSQHLETGHALVKNPYGSQPYRVSLRSEDVSGFVFWTRNCGPFFPALDQVERRQTPFVVQYTVTGYPGALETSTITPAKAVDHMGEIGKIYGAGRVVWRYDPVLITSLTDADWHVRNFKALADRIAPHVDEVVFSFAHIYRKTRGNLASAAKEHGFTWADPDADEKTALLARLGEIAVHAGLKPTLCAQPDFLPDTLSLAACIDVTRLSRIAGHDIAAPIKGNRPGCLCAQSRDIGAYDTCPHGCVYCYAVRNRETAKENFARHNHNDETLG